MSPKPELVTDAVVRKLHFEQAHPGVSFSVDELFMAHRAVWIDPGTGNEQSIRSLSLSLLLDQLDKVFAPGPEPKIIRHGNSGPPYIA